MMCLANGGGRQRIAWKFSLHHSRHHHPKYPRPIGVRRKLSQRISLNDSCKRSTVSIPECFDATETKRPSWLPKESCRILEACGSEENFQANSTVLRFPPIGLIPLSCGSEKDCSCSRLVDFSQVNRKENTKEKHIVKSLNSGKQTALLPGFSSRSGQAKVGKTLKCGFEYETPPQTPTGSLLKLKTPPPPMQTRSLVLPLANIPDYLFLPNL